MNTVALNSPDESCLPDLSADLFRSTRRSDELGAKYTDEQLISAIERYRKFLRLNQLYPDVALAPSRDIDDMWHMHMLNPVAYHADCMRLFGYILDHDGGFGHDTAEIPVLQKTFDLTASLWEQEYGKSYINTHYRPSMTKCRRNCVSRCQRQCKVK